MDLLAKFGIYVGIGIALIFFSIFLIMVLPNVIQDAGRQWDEIFTPKLSNEELRSLFYETEAYKEFLTRYPSAGEHFEPYGNGEGQMEISAMNFETNNMLSLEMRYEKHEDIRLEIRCNDKLGDKNLRVKGTLAVQVIKEVNCLDDEGFVSAPSPLIDKNGEYVPICGNNAKMINGVCVDTKGN